VTTALVSSGLPTDRFCFEGFLPARGVERRQRLEALRDEPRTLVLFEAPHRLVALLEDMLQVLGDRPLRVARELTKRHEEQVGPTVAAALEHFRCFPPRGECTLVLGGADPPAERRWDETCLRLELEALIGEGHSPSGAARRLAQRTGLRRRELYALLHRAPESQERPDADAASGSGAMPEGTG
jgi:16S rRNA (cytidine1402-2'-O)-methyltransferase